MEEKKEPMKILGLKVDGLRKLSAAELEFSENGLTQIKGKNKQGKSTVIDSIEWLIRGNKTLNKEAINSEKTKAEGELRLGNFLIKRVITEKSTKLEVKNIGTNEPVKGEVQNFLDTFINELTFNPRALENLTKVEKYKFIMKLYNIDFSDIDKKIESLAQDRTLTYREIAKYGDPVEPERVERIDIQELLNQKKEIDGRDSLKRIEYENAKQKELEEINDFNKVQREKKTKIEQAQKDLEQIASLINNIESDIKELEIELKRKREKRDERVHMHDLIELDIKNLLLPEPEKPLTSSIPIPLLENDNGLEDKIQTAFAINEKAKVHENWQKKTQEKAQKQVEYNALDAKIKFLRDEKIAKLHGIDTKVQGLEIGEEDLYYNGVGSENWSDSERLRITSELCLAMMPDLRAMFIDGLESMDIDSLKELDKWAKENDVQIIGTYVSNEKPTPSKNVVFIEEGILIK